MMDETISIIIPVYNTEDYLPACLDSVLSQTYHNLEVIVVDDGSTDRSGDILRSYRQKDPRVVVLQQPNCGVVKARMNGIRQASGQWIGFVDSDDFIEPEMFARLYHNARKFQVDISHCGYQMVFPSRIDFYHNTGKIIRQDRERGLSDLLEGAFVEPGLWNKLFHRPLFTTLLQSDLEDSGIKIYEDLLMNFFLFREAKDSVYEDCCPYHYMVRAGSAATEKKPQHFSDPVKVFERIQQELAGDVMLLPIARKRYVYTLITAAVQNTYPEIAKESGKKLKQLPGMELFGLGVKLGGMAWMVSRCRFLYRGIRKGYEAITRVNHKFDVE